MVEFGNLKKKVVRLFKTPFAYFLLCFVFMNLLFTKQVLDKNGVEITWPIMLVEVLIELVLFVLLARMREKGKPLEKQFVLLAIVIGVLFLIIMPPGQSPDDINHFRRAYGISEGVLIPYVINEEDGRVGSELPVKVRNNLRELSSHGSYDVLAGEMFDGDVGEYEEQAYANTALYNFVCYIPQTIAILFGKIFNLSIVGMAYMVKTVNFLFWVVLVFFAIKMMPKFRNILLFIALLPISLQEATSMSPDSLTIGLSMFLVAYVLHLTYVKKDKACWFDYAAITVISVVMSFCKIVYLPLAFLFWMIPYERFGTKKRKWLFLGSVTLLVAILNVLWLKVSSQFLIEFNPGVNSQQQLAGIMSNPIKYGIVIMNSVNANSHFWLTSMLGMTLGSFEFNLPTIFFYVSFTLLVVLVLQRDEYLKIRKIDRCLVAAVFFGILGLICTSLYIQWTALGAGTIEGIQGRYFLPILILIPIIICRTKPGKRRSIVTDKTVLYYSVIVNVIALVTIFAQNV